jgi:hypothetical protein
LTSSNKPLTRQIAFLVAILFVSLAHVAEQH